jgi:NAD(P)-dependent dehydrogenase (short-subunit alcohol dehydrogenase family)
MDLAGANAIVTGAAVGTGRAIAERLAAEGAHVVVADVDERGGAETVARIGDGGRGSCAPTCSCRLTSRR